ncbi:putative RNA helicase [Rosa chinensis]|uniref:RNA helicase n=1 Tax=Rosa chinensis TaxID=74649 RepID=A0A2P6QP77_ROSCH|nr:putative RNA helicase [Rosa chinensis]
MHGSILFFVTGKREIESLCQKLLRAWSKMFMKMSIGSDSAEVSEINSGQEITRNEISEAFDVHDNLNDHQTDSDRFCSDDEYHYEVVMTDDDVDSLWQDAPEIDGNVADILKEKVSIVSLKAAFEGLVRKTSLGNKSDGKQPNSVTDLDACSNQSNCLIGKKGSVKDGRMPGALCLHAFEKVKEGERLVVVATNVAGTSKTIRGIKYVVDTGKVKVKKYNPSNSMETFEVEWMSKASADQRKGRAGRTGPGHCHRLYSSAVYDNFPEFSVPEISKVPVDGLVLLLKSMDIHEGVVEVELCLNHLGALDENKRVTSSGKAMAWYPISPRQSRMLLTIIQIMHKKKIDPRPNLVLLTIRPGIKKEWLVGYARSLCTLPDPKKVTRHSYDPITDQVVHDVVPTFGDHLCDLPPHPQAISEFEDRVKAFAFALLDGQVFPCLKPVSKSRDPPLTIVLRPLELVPKQIWNHLEKLKTKNIDSCAMLLEVWKVNPWELYQEIGECQKSLHSKFGSLWLDMLKQVGLDLPR